MEAAEPVLLNVDEGIKLLRNEFGIAEDDEEGDGAYGGAGAFAEQVNRP